MKKIITCFILAMINPVYGVDYIVNSVSDSQDQQIDGVCFTGILLNGVTPECTLRAAIQEANATPVEDTVGFIIGACPDGVCVLSVNSLLPEITTPVMVDASGQTGNSGVCDAIAGRSEYKVVLQGDGTFDGLRLGSGSDGSVVSGLNLRNFLNPVTIINSNDNQVKCNLIGTDETGMAVTNNNGSNGVILGCSSQNNIIGGMNNDGNVISGHAVDGVQFYGGFLCNPTDNEPKNNAVLGNFIGTLKDGVTGAGNVFGGVSFFDGAAGNNYIGSLTDGISINPNVIADSESGIFIDNGVIGTKIFGNFIGTDLTGIVDLGHEYGGIDILSGNDTQIGGEGLVYGNTIANNREGILISGSASSGNHYSLNLIYHNENLSVDVVRDGDVEPDGINANDIDDSDTGANNLMNNVMVSSVAVIEDVINGDFVAFEFMVDATGQNASYPLLIDSYVAPYGSGIFEWRSNFSYETPQLQETMTIDLQGLEGIQVKFVVTDNDRNASEMSAIYEVNNPDVIFENGFEL